MKLPLVFFITYLISAVAAYDLYGGYERMFYYYAYLIDCGTHDGTPSHIAVSCSSVMGVRGGAKCSFNQFIAFINNARDKNGNIIPVSISDDLYPDVDRTANALNNAKLTGTYELGRIYPGVANSVSDLFTKVAGVVAGNLGSNAQLANARKAIDRVQFLRGYANLSSLKDLLSGMGGVKIKLKTGTNGPITYNDILDIAATINESPGMKSKIETAIANDNAGNKAHLDNVQAARTAKTKLVTCKM